MVLAIDSALVADGDLLSPAERADIDGLISSAKTSRSLDDAAQIEAVTQTLAKGTEAFAAVRMNRGIQKALAGKNIETI